MNGRGGRYYLTPTRRHRSPLTRPSTAWRLPRPFTANESSPCNDRHANDQDRRNRRRHEQMLFYSPAPFTADRRYRVTVGRLTDGRGAVNGAGGRRYLTADAYSPTPHLFVQA